MSLCITIKENNKKKCKSFYSSALMLFKKKGQLLKCP